jgi:acyl transferase domain-containing protein/NADPH:quinone reductase-like Zn-dependent oxidoreductase/NAD(P)-dependent dehydrogenase (short-subunit alcohol dehydrogenase family)/SAM-dependent methyltransferase/acyl carrier protein
MPADCIDQSPPADQLATMQKERIAIIGVGCRFPGGVNSVDSLWKLLVEGREGVVEVPADRWNVERYYDSQPGIAGKSIAKRGGFIDGIDQFDPQFFGISPREAPYVDPQHRLLLETAWEAIEDAGVVLDFEHGTDLGVFVGISHNDYQGIQSTPFDHFSISPHTPTGSAHSIAANRISYCLNLRGPSVAMDTACSSALTAVHAACEHIWAGRGHAALAGGVTVMIAPGGFIGFSQAGMLSPEGRCAAFDASASGFVRGEGAGMVLLKRLSKAIEDGDPIQGVILGTSINQDGHTNGISLPSPEAQTRLVQDACKDAGIEPEAIGFVEAHGTGTAVGDPIEANALAAALCHNRSAEAPLPIGSIKTNLGHLETAAGVAGLLKAMLVVKYGQIPPSLHFKSPNPHIDFEKTKLRVPTTLEPFPETNGERIAGVNSFGFGGANAHVIVAAPPAHQPEKSSAIPGSRPWPVTLSARSEKSLRLSAASLSAWIKEHANANGSSPVLPDLTYTLGVRRNHHAHRLSLVASNWTELTEQLDGFAAEEDALKIRSGFTPRGETAMRIGFIMSGQGPQWWGMGRELMEHEAVFREMMERCDAALRPWTRFRLLEELFRTEESTQMARTEIGQPAIFAMQMALAALWKSWGIEPTAIVGHSVGEIAAACVAGIFSLEEAARVIALRARLMEQCGRGEGTMLAIGLPEEEAVALIARHDRTVTISALNGPRSITLSGPRVSLEAIAAELEAQGAFARLVKVDHPFHHPLMAPAADTLESELADLQPQPSAIPFFSTVTGERCAGESCNAAYWARGIRQPVLFASAVNELAEFGVDLWLELNAHPALAHATQECLAAKGTKAIVVSSIRREREIESLLESAMDLHRAGVAVDFSAMTPSRHLLPLPAYAWEKTRWWHEASDAREGRLAPGGRGLFDIRLPSAMPTWIVRLDARHMEFLKDHKVENHVIFPAAAFVEMALEAGVQLFEGRPFVVEDFEIRKPLILPDPAAGVQLEFSYSPGERTFAIQSRLEQSVSWSLHVVGSLRGERTESAFSSSTWKQPRTVQPLAVDEFYQHMSDLGLRYGEEFRSVRELAAGLGEAAGRVALSETTAPRALEYALHPVLFDGALHIFSAGAATVEDRQARMKLPVRFGRILFLNSPGACSRVCAKVRNFSDDFLEGDLALFDEEGNPCVQVDGFRAISLASAARSAAPGGRRDLTYPSDRARTPNESAKDTLAPLPLTELRSAVQQAVDRVIDIRGHSELENALVALDELTAAQLARGLREMGVSPRESFDTQTVGIASHMHPVFERLMSSLVRRGLFREKKNAWMPTARFFKAADSAEKTLRHYLEQHPGHLPEALLCAGTCAELGMILRGEKDAVQVLFSGNGAELLDHFYGDGLFSSPWLAGIAAAVSAAARSLPEGRGLRILEVGAGTGGLAAQVLPSLERGLHSYIFTDISASFFSPAEQKLAAFPEVEFKAFDLEKPGIDQGLEPGSFDFIIGTNVLHAVKDVRATLRDLHRLLVPGGSLIFMDTATPQLWTEAVFGLTSGWWRFTDRDLRPEQPLLQRSQWESVLRETGFAETASLPGLIGPTGGEGQIGLFARKCYEKIEIAAEVNASVPEEKSWLLFADRSSLGDDLASRLQSVGARSRVVRQGNHFASGNNDEFTLRPGAREDWQKLIEACEKDSPERVVYLWGLDAQVSDMAGNLDALLHFCQELERARPAAKLRLEIISRNAQPAGRDQQPTTVEQAPAIGLTRVILNEHPNLCWRSIDLPPESSSADVTSLWQELTRDDAEREIALRGEARYVRRLDRGRPTREQWLDPAQPLQLSSRERGHLDSLHFVPFQLPECGPGQVLIEVKAAGMNFRDVLKALALYPGDAPDARIFGDEVAGIVRVVGPGVKHVAPGDRVFGLAVFGLATHTLTRAGDVRKIPAGLSFEAAATLPVVFMTAWHALQNVARVRKNERVLVHAGAGGVGMAAIQIAQHLGARVIASAGSPSKRALLKTLGVEHVIDSRRGDFAESVMALTVGKGVEVVLNALAAEAIPMGLGCLAEFGRFIEIGKRDIYQNSRIPLRPLRNNSSFHVVAMDAVFHGDEELTRQMLEEISKLIEKRALRPLPFRAFPASRADAAFRLMSGGKHIGKVVVSFPAPFVPPRGEMPGPGFEIKSNAAYLITGAFGGYGKVLARWLVDSGARHLVLSSRSGAASPEAGKFVAELEKRHVEVRVVAADVSLPNDVRRLFAEIESGPQLRGVFHLAMVIDDAPFSALTPERMRAVLEPKATGAWLLHEATREMDLDCFVMFSSVSSVFGNPAQGNYSAANAFIDSLAHHRQALGLPALTVNWGVLGGEGYVARNERVADFLARQGTQAITPTEATSLLESFLGAGSAQVIAIRVDWSKWRQFFRGMQSNPLLERIFASLESEESTGTTSNWRSRIDAAAPTEKQSVICQAVREAVGSVLRVKPDSLRDDQPLTDLGLDSLMGVEIETSLEAAIGVALPPTSLMRARTIGQIGALIAGHLGGTKAVAESAPVPVTTETASAVDLEAISDEEIERLLGEPSSEEQPEAVEGASR